MSMNAQLQPTGNDAPAPAPSPAATPPRFDRKFIEDHHLIERYLTGKLPLKGARDLENWCRANPQYLEELQLGQRAQGSLKLLEAAGQPQDLGEPKIPWWKTPYFNIGLGVLAAACLIAFMVLFGKYMLLQGELEDVKLVAKQGSLAPPSASEAMRLEPDRVPDIDKARLSISHSTPTLINLKVDLSYTKIALFKVTIEKKGQGRVLVIDNLGKDSNGDLRFTFNSSGLTPGQYRVRVEGLPFRADPIGMAWFIIDVT
jgi:hypothetical protein